MTKEEDLLNNTKEALISLILGVEDQRKLLSLLPKSDLTLRIDNDDDDDDDSRLMASFEDIIRNLFENNQGFSKCLIGFLCNEEESDNSSSQQEYNDSIAQLYPMYWGHDHTNYAL